MFDSCNIGKCFSGKYFYIQCSLPLCEQDAYVWYEFDIYGAKPRNQMILMLAFFHCLLFFWSAIRLGAPLEGIDQ